jgi:hypothetical protein
VVGGERGVRWAAALADAIALDALLFLTRRGCVCVCLWYLQARITIRQVISGIEAVHAVDLVHRDLKLENIGVTKEGVVKLLDFGLAGDIRGKDMLETQCGTMWVPPNALLCKLQ